MLTLISALILKPASETWSSNTYQVKARGVDFTIDNRSVDIELPPAEVSYSTTSGNSVTKHTVSTAPTKLTVELPVPKGHM